MGLVCSVAIAASMGVVPIQTSVGSNTIAVASAASVYTKSFPMANAEYVSAFYKASSDGTVAVTIYFEQSYTKPTTEGAVDSLWATTDTLTAVTDENAHVEDVDKEIMPYGRFHVVGGATNDSTTALSMKVVTQ
jgi:hypothetical protein